MTTLSAHRSQEQIQRGGGGGGRGSGPPLEKHKNKRFLSNTGPDPLKNHKATKPAFKVGPSSARQQNTISMTFHWGADDGPLLVLFLDPLSYQLKKKQNNVIKFGPPLKNLSGSAHAGKLIHPDRGSNL